MPAISESNATYASHALPPSRGLWRDPSVLERSWTPPALAGRGEALAQLEGSVRPVLASGGRAAVSIQGPRGSGTSALAAHLVATAKDRLTRPGAKGTPLVLRVDASVQRSPSALVTALFREIDPSYDGRGVSTEFGLLLFLRRLRTLGRPAVLLFDKIGAVCDLSRVLRPLARPDRLLPEGTSGFPPMLVVAAGLRDAFPMDVEALRVALPPLRTPELVQAVQAREKLAFWTPPTQEAAEAIARLSTAQGWGLSMIGELLTEAGRRCEARGGSRVEAEDVALPSHVPRHGADAEGFSAVILEALRDAGTPLPLGVFRQRVEVRCGALGIRAPTQARLWRHLVALERKGVVRREVRMGGKGGTLALVALRDLGEVRQEQRGVRCSPTLPLP